MKILAEEGSKTRTVFRSQDDAEKALQATLAALLKKEYADRLEAVLYDESHNPLTDDLERENGTVLETGRLNGWLERTNTEDGVLFAITMNDGTVKKFKISSAEGLCEPKPLIYPRLFETLDVIREDALYNMDAAEVATGCILDVINLKLSVKDERLTDSQFRELAKRILEPL